MSYVYGVFAYVGWVWLAVVIALLLVLRPKSNEIDSDEKRS